MFKIDSKSLFFYEGTSRKDLGEVFRGRISSIVARFCGRIPRKDPRKDLGRIRGRKSAEGKKVVTELKYSN